MQNPFVYFVELLGIKHTKKYTCKVYNEHPFKNSLYAFSSLLTDYGVDNVTIELFDEDKDIAKLEAPLVVTHGTSILAIVSKIEKDLITFSALNNKDIKVTPENFNQLWSGIALMAETNPKSSEPHYIKHKLSGFFEDIQLYLLMLFALAIVVFSIWTKGLYQNAGIMSLLAINLVGLFVSVLLILKNHRIQSDYADKVCSLLHEGNCNEILDSDASKLFGLISWSEVGFSYFVSNCVILLFFPALIPLMAIINVCALPYSFWSVWYQKFKANSWCIMCLIVQASFWVMFVVTLYFGYFNAMRESFNFPNFVVLGCIYAIPFILTHQLLSLIIERSQSESKTQEFNSLKGNDDVIKALLLKEPRFEVDKQSSQILFGNKDAEILITIMTNPHCNPCARVHNKLAEILTDTTGKFCIQYIFSSFGSAFDDSSQFMIATYLNNLLHETCRIYHDWYSKGGRANRRRFFQQHQVPIDEICMNEFNKHNEWREKANLKATPAILVNGYQLPKQYQIEDIVYFTTIDFNGLQSTL